MKLKTIYTLAEEQKMKILPINVYLNWTQTLVYGKYLNLWIQVDVTIKAL